MRYINKKNGKVAKIVEQSDKFKTVMLEMEEDGKTISITTSTLKRWWKKLDEDSEIHAPEIDQEQVEESDVSSDGTPYSEIMKEIISDEKKLIASVNKDKSLKSQVRESAFQDLKSLLNTVKGITQVREWAPYSLAIKVEGKAFAEIRSLKSGEYTLYLKESFAESVGFTYRRINNYYLPAVIKGVSLDIVKAVFKEVSR